MTTETFTFSHPFDPAGGPETIAAADREMVQRAIEWMLANGAFRIVKTATTRTATLEVVMPPPEIRTKCLACDGDGRIVTDVTAYMNPPADEPDAGTKPCGACHGTGWTGGAQADG